MTDKVEQIRQETKKQINIEEEWMERQGFSDIHIGMRTAYQNILSFIDSLQEEPEPKFKVGDCIKPIDSCLGSQRTIYEVCDGWYVTNQGTLDFEYENNWELVEEPVSEDLKEAAVKIAKKITADTNSETVWSKTVQGVIAGANYVLKEIEIITKADLGSYKSQLDRIKKVIEQLKK